MFVFKITREPKRKFVLYLSMKDALNMITKNLYLIRESNNEKEKKSLEMKTILESLQDRISQMNFIYAKKEFYLIMQFHIINTQFHKFLIKIKRNSNRKIFS